MVPGKPGISTYTVMLVWQKWTDCSQNNSAKFTYRSNKDSKEQKKTTCSEGKAKEGKCNSCLANGSGKMVRDICPNACNL